MSRTSLENIPDIEQLDGGGEYMGKMYTDGYATERELPDVSRKIRGNPRVYEVSGMVRENPGQSFSAPPITHGGYRELSCREISDHIQECPICQKFYNQDNTTHMIIIILLSVVSALLLKKVLDI